MSTWKFCTKSTLNAVLEHCCRTPRNCTSQRIPEVKRCHGFTRNVLYLCFLRVTSPDLAFIPVTYPKPVPAREDAAQGIPENHGIAEVMLQLELILQPCEQAGKLWKNPGSFSSLRWFCWAQTSSTFPMSLNFKIWLSECDSNLLMGRNAGKRNR